ncbi:26s proteasome non-atpase regulatory subunit [Anaeramoeba flamelloides]|uniref:26s proteasome non-atpase regulatory subunit n=1 Tax=Anaeramoeba flamelloides TaxID=1746091 RepID=A0AAV7YF12_9EUKA|nr:26s proteasome non-atpase regulatory subunit [Anaeramoeba flamelloides]
MTKPESCILLVDNSIDSIKNDYLPSRLLCQFSWVHLICRSILSFHNQSYVGLIPMTSSYQSICIPLTRDLSSILGELIELPSIDEPIQIEKSILLSTIMLNHKKNKKKSYKKIKRLILFSTCLITDSLEKIRRISKILSKEKIAVDIICMSGCRRNREKFKILSKSWKNKFSGGKIIELRPKSQSKPSDIILNKLFSSVPEYNSQKKKTSFNLIGSPKDDPELDLVLTMSLIEENIKQKSKTKNDCELIFDECNNDECERDENNILSSDEDELKYFSLVEYRLKQIEERKKKQKNQLKKIHHNSFLSLFGKRGRFGTPRIPTRRIILKDLSFRTKNRTHFENVRNHLLSESFLKSTLEQLPFVDYNSSEIQQVLTELKTDKFKSPQLPLNWNSDHVTKHIFETEEKILTESSSMSDFENEIDNTIKNEFGEVNNNEKNNQENGNENDDENKIEIEIEIERDKEQEKEKETTEKKNNRKNINYNVKENKDEKELGKEFEEQEKDTSEIELLKENKQSSKKEK